MTQVRKTLTLFAVQCGEVEGLVRAKSAGEAFRKLLKDAGDDVLLAPLARFSSPGKKWHYQDPLALEKSP